MWSHLSIYICNEVSHTRPQYHENRHGCPEPDTHHQILQKGNSLIHYHKWIETVNRTAGQEVRHNYRLYLDPCVSRRKRHVRYGEGRKNEAGSPLYICILGQWIQPLNRTLAASHRTGLKII